MLELLCLCSLVKKYKMLPTLADKMSTLHRSLAASGFRCCGTAQLLIEGIYEFILRLLQTGNM